MMEPEQILEHARAAEAAGAHRFCMVTQGQGLSKRDFDKVLEGARLVAEQTNLKRCASIGHMSVARARQLKDAGIQRVHHNVESAESYYPEVSTTVRYDGRLRTIDAVREAGLETCVGGILNLGESRAPSASRWPSSWPAIDPTSVPINLLNPRPGTKFGDREYMDPWEAVKWIAIFRLILPARALPPLRRPRREHRRAPAARRPGGDQRRDDGQLPHDPGQHARGGPGACSRSTASTSPRQPDNGANPRPDNRSGWLDGDTPAIDDFLDAATPAGRGGRHRRAAVGPVLPAALRAQGGGAPRPDGAPNVWREARRPEPAGADQ